MANPNPITASNATEFNAAINDANGQAGAETISVIGPLVITNPSTVRDALTIETGAGGSLDLSGLWGIRANTTVNSNVVISGAGLEAGVIQGATLFLNGVMSGNATGPLLTLPFGGSGGAVVLGGAGANTWSGANIVVAQGSLSFARGDQVNTTTGITVSSNFAKLVVTGTTEVTRTLSGDATVEVTTGVVTWSGVITGFGLTKTGAGTLLLTGANTVDIITVDAGVVEISGGAAVGDTAALRVNSGGALRVLATETFGQLSVYSGATATLNEHADISINQNGSLQGQLSGRGNLFFTGAGALQLHGNNVNWTGNVSASSGSLNVQNGAAIGDAALVTLTGTANLNLAFGAETIGSLRADDARTTVTLDWGLTLGDASSTTVAGNISNANGASGGVLTKQGSGELTLSGTNTYTGATVVTGGTLTLSGGAAIRDTAAVSLGAAGTLKVATAETIGALSGVAGSKIILNAGLTAGDATSATIDGVISGAGGLIKAGAGTLTLSGANTYTGLTTVNAGTLELTGGRAIADTGAISVADGATLTISAAERVGAINTTVNGTLRIDSDLTIGDATNSTWLGNTRGTGTLTKVGTGTLTVDVTAGNASPRLGQVTVSEGVLLLRGNDVTALYTAPTTVAAGATLRIGTTQTIGSIAGAGAIQLDATVALSGSASTTFSGVISGVANAGLSVVNNNLVLTGANTFTGTVLLNTGSLELRGGAALADTVRVSLGAGALIVTNAETIGAFSGGQVGSQLILNANLTMAGASTSWDMRGVISGSGSLIKNNAGTVSLWADNTFTGDLAINTGNVTVKSTGGIADTARVFLGATGSLHLEKSETIGLLTGDAGSIISLLGSVGAPSILTTGGAANSTFAGVMSGNDGGLIKVGTGTLTLTGANWFTGATTVSAGTLIVNGQLSYPGAGGNGSAITVKSSATLGGTGAVWTVTVESGGALAPGNRAGTITTYDLTLNSGGALRAEIGSAVSFDQVKVQGTVTLVAGARLDVSMLGGFAPALGQTFMIIDNDAADAVVGTFASLAEGATVSAGLNNFRISYVGGDGNDVVLTALAPTPPSSGGGGGGGGSFVPATPQNLTGGDGADLLQGGDLADTLNGGGGDDSLLGGMGDDVLTGGAGADFLHGNQGNDSLSGGDGADTVHGGQGDDIVSGGAGADILYGDFGADSVEGGDGDDLIFGGQGPVSGIADLADTIRGGAGNDIIQGNKGEDLLFGDDGADVIRGGADNDTIDGGAGNDILYGDLGDDVLTGGSGADLFVFAPGMGNDRVMDFNLAQGDQIHLEAGMTWTAVQAGADVDVTLSGGGHVFLVGINLVSISSGNWIGVG